MKDLGLCIDGRYRLKRWLAAGSFGDLYKASHEAFGLELRPVAVKISKEPMGRERASRAFHDALRMAEYGDLAAAEGLGEHFVRVFDAGMVVRDGQEYPYAVMELVRGTTLAHCLKSRRFPLKRARDY